MKKLYEFYWDCGRMGSISGLFIAEENDVMGLIGENIYFGEVLGKHSDVSGDITEDDFTVKTDDQEFITKFLEIMELNETGTISGYNPFEYYEPEE